MSSIKNIYIRYVTVKGGNVSASVVIDGEQIDFVKVKRVFFNDFCIENDYEVGD